MENIAVTNARNSFSDIINKVSYGKERISLTRQNKPVAYIISVEDMELLERIEDKIILLELESNLEELKEPSISL